MEVLEGGNIVGDLGTPDRNCAFAKSDIASRIVLVMEACRLMHEEAAAVTGFEPDQMRGISRGRFNSVSADELQAALEALEAWKTKCCVSIFSVCDLADGADHESLRRADLRVD